MARTREAIIAFGKKKQADIATANVLADLWRLHKVNTSQLANPRYITEDDAADGGKGHEFATTLFKSHMDGGPHTLEKYLSSEFAAWLWAYGLGKVVKSGSGPYTYTCTALNPVTDGEELPYFSFLEAIRQGGSAVLDRMLVGNRISSFRIQIASGPGRTNARATVQFMHSGVVTEPSSITLPAATAETALNAYSLAATINGVNYVSAKNFVSLEMGLDTPADDQSDYYPGSGQQDGYQVRGRMEIGDRAPTFNFVARYVNGSSELAKVRDLTTGTAVVSLTADSDNVMTVTWQKLAFQVAEISDTNGRVTVTITGKPMYHSTNGLVTAVCKCSVDGIAQ